MIIVIIKTIIYVYLQLLINNKCCKVIIWAVVVCSHMTLTYNYNSTTCLHTHTTVTVRLNTLCSE